mgnify:CR=1 FL=1
MDEVIEIESEEELTEEKVDSKPVEPAGKVIFSSLFSQSSNETDEELEVKEIGDTITKIKRAGYELELQFMDTKMRQNYHEECKALINKQINMEFDARYVYIFHRLVMLFELSLIHI